MMDTTERIINAGLKGAIGGAFLLGLIYLISYIWNKINKSDGDRGDRSGAISQANAITQTPKIEMANTNQTDLSVDEESLWAEALECYEKKREAGLYARLFAEKNGDEQKIKAEYLRIKFSQLKAEKIEGARRLLKEKSLSQKASQIQAIKTGAYELKKNRSSEYFLMWDGMVAVPSPKGNYGIYTSETLAIQSIDHFESYGEYKSKGLVFIITAEEYASYQVVYEARKASNRKKSTPDKNMTARVPKR